MEKIISVYWFAILFLVAGGVYMMVASFYGKPYDIREVEANILSEKVADCISYAGVVNPKIYDINKGFNFSFEQNFLKECNLNFNVENDWSRTQYFILVEFFDINEKPVFNFSAGNFNLKANCEVQKEKSYKKLGYCLKKKFYSTSGDKQFLIKITSVVAKNEKNIE